MSLVKWNSGNLFPALDTIWDDFLGKDFFNKSVQLGTSMPAINVNETESDFRIEVAAPGLKKEDLKINIESNLLSISSEKEEEKEQKEGDKVIRREFNYSSFKRIFQLPKNVSKENINAEYKDGLLKISLPKQKDEIHEKKQIAIN